MMLNDKKSVWNCINRVYYSGLTTTSGGNISSMDSEGNIYITPSGIDKGSLFVEDIVTVDKDKNILGKHKPSMELPFHSNIYIERKDIRAIVHAHAPAVVAYATARRVPDSMIAPCYNRLLGIVGDSRYDLPGSLTLGDIVKAEFEKGYNAIMMHNHGATVGGKTLEEAFSKYEALDNLCNVIINAEQLGGVKTINVLSDYSKSLTPVVVNEDDMFTSEENKIRDSIAKFLSRSYTQKLVSNSYGTIFYKLDNGDILFNPDSVSRYQIKYHDIAKYSNGNVVGTSDIKCDYLDIALNVFDSVKEAKVCFISMPNNAMGFACSNTYFDSRLIPESYIMLKNAVQLPYNTSSEDIANAMSTSKPLCLVDNECVITIGKDLTKAFDRMEVTDFSCKSVIMAKSIASITPINDEQTAEIDRTFNGW